MHILLDKFHQGGKYTAQIENPPGRVEKRINNY